MRKAVIFGVLIAALGLSGCKDGDTISGAGLQPTAAFTADPVPPGVTEDFVSLRVASINGGRITLDIVVTEVDETVTGINLLINYPNGLASFMGCADGDLFPVPRAPFCSETNPGELLITRFVVTPEPGAMVSGERTILSLEFLVFGVTQGPITIESQNLGGGSALFDAVGDPIQVAWFSGELRGE